MGVFEQAQRVVCNGGSALSGCQGSAGFVNGAIGFRCRARSDCVHWVSNKILPEPRLDVSCQLRPINDGSSSRFPMKQRLSEHTPGNRGLKKGLLKKGFLSHPLLVHRPITSRDALTIWQSGINWRLTSQEARLATCAVAVIALAVLNRMLFKMALVSMKDHPLFLAQFATAGYASAYAVILGVRLHRGLVTKEMLAHPKGNFLAIGALEAVGSVGGMASAIGVPGVLLPVLGQGFLVWQLALSALILRRKYSTRQLVGVSVLLMGIAVVVLSGNTPSGGGTVHPAFSIAYLCTMAFSALASILKEKTFQDAKKHTKGGNLDVFVVGCFASSFQALFVLLLLPAVVSLSGSSAGQLPSVLASGAGCFFSASGVKSCRGAPLVPLLYMASNICSSIANVSLLKMSSAVVPSLALTLSVPLSVAVFTLPLPMLGRPAALSPLFFAGTCIILAGLVVYLSQEKRLSDRPAHRRVLPHTYPHVRREAPVAYF